MGFFQYECLKTGYQTVWEKWRNWKKKFRSVTRLLLVARSLGLGYLFFRYRHLHRAAQYFFASRTTLENTNITKRQRSRNTYLLYFMLLYRYILKDFQAHYSYRYPPWCIAWMTHLGEFSFYQVQLHFVVTKEISCELHLSKYLNEIFFLISPFFPYCLVAPF